MGWDDDDELIRIKHLQIHSAGLPTHSAVHPKYAPKSCRFMSAVGCRAAAQRNIILYFSAWPRLRLVSMVNIPTCPLPKNLTMLLLLLSSLLLTTEGPNTTGRTVAKHVIMSWVIEFQLSYDIRYLTNVAIDLLINQSVNEPIIVLFFDGSSLFGQAHGS